MNERFPEAMKREVKKQVEIIDGYQTYPILRIGCVKTFFHREPRYFQKNIYKIRFI